MISLDDMGAMARVDKSGMLMHLDGFPGQCRTGWELGGAWASEVGPETPGALVIAGRLGDCRGFR
jgi:hypothetical protein